LTATDKKINYIIDLQHMWLRFYGRLRISDDLFFNNFPSMEVRCGGNTFRS